MVDTVLGRKSSEVSHRNKKSAIITRARSSGGGNATPALFGGLGSVLCLEFNNLSFILTIDCHLMLRFARFSVYSLHFFGNIICILTKFSFPGA